MQPVQVRERQRFAFQQAPAPAAAAAHWQRGSLPCLNPRGRVLISINTSWNIYNFRAGLIRALIEDGYEVIAAAPPDDYSRRLEEIGCRYLPLPVDNKGTSPFRDAALLLRFARLIHHVRPDTFLGYTVKPNVYGSLAAHAAGVPVVNNISGLGTAFLGDSWLTWGVKRLYRLSLKRSKIVFFQNAEDMALFAREGLVKERQAKLLPGSGVDLARFRPDGRFARAADARFRFLLVARLLWDKGIGDFVEAARIVQRQAPEVSFQLLGPLDVENRTAIDRATVDDWVSEGVVEYLGASDDVRPAVAAADCVVLPSYREGMPRTLLEAAAMAKPLIATDVPGCRQIVEHGVNGLLCRARNARDLAEKMLDMLALAPDRCAAMGAAGRAKVEREYDEAFVIDRYRAAIAGAISSRRPAP